MFDLRSVTYCYNQLKKQPLIIKNDSTFTVCKIIPNYFILENPYIFHIMLILNIIREKNRESNFFLKKKKFIQLAVYTRTHTKTS
jgi:hypothetical protein